MVIVLKWGVVVGEVNIIISEEKLVHLMELGVLSGSEISSEDFVVKQLVQSMCLKQCSSKLCAHCAFSDVCGKHVQGKQMTYISPNIY